MSVIGKALKRGIHRCERLSGNPVFTYNGIDYPCLQNVSGLSRMLGLGGFANEQDLTLFVRVEVFPNVQDPQRPLETQSIQFEGKTYRINKISTLPGGDVLRYDCIESTRGVNAK